jgi:catechol 2,3-dioxygenase-like lactoylglutathione lyase family enzyme
MPAEVSNSFTFQFFRVNVTTIRGEVSDFIRVQMRHHYRFRHYNLQWKTHLVYYLQNMKSNHLNLVVSAVDSAVEFFSTHFNFRLVENRKDALAVLTNEDGFILVLWSSKLNKSNLVEYPEPFHIGFYQKDQHAVMTVYDKLLDGGVNLTSAPRKMRDTFGFYF